MLRLRRFSENYRELFVARYDQLLAWAMQLSQGDRSVAEDLLHDLYVLFSIHEPNIDLGQNVDGYLYTCLRNLYLSQLRRAARVRFQQLSIVEYESAKTGLRAIDPRTQIEVQDDLRRVCQYACARKETSRMGSVLILRFFHGYYPSEIVRVLRTSRKAVDRRLALARAEARSYLDNIEGLAFMTGKLELPEIFPANFARTPADLLSELRQMIFASRQRDCLSSDQLHSLYQPSKRNDQTEEMVAMSCAELAHLVSCVACLNEVNSMLKLPPLSQRYLTDLSGKDPGGRGGDGGSSTGGGPRQVPKSAKARKLIESGRLDDWDDDAREAFEHKPQELCVAVNGYLLGSQRVGLEQNDLTLSLNPEEKPTFVEVFSEQGIRLSLMSIGDPPPEGTGEQRLQVNLSDARELELTLHFTEPFMTLRVAYHDPALKSEADALGSEALVASDDSVSFSRQQPKTSGTEITRGRFSGLIHSLRERLFTGWFWPRPGTVTALVALILIGCLLLLYLRHPGPVVTAASVLRRSADAEELASAQPNTVLHRTLNLEEMNAKGELIARSKIEIWQSAGRGITARRLYNEKAELIAGDWRRADGVQTLYHHGTRPQLQLAPEKRASVPLSFDKVWELEPSASEFIQLIGDPQGAKIEEQPARYVISYANRSASGLIKATLVMSRDDLHPTEQTLLIAANGEQREYRFTEANFERRAPEAVAPTVFEPEPELLSENPKAPDTAKEKAATTTPLAVIPPPASASSELEVEVLRLLHQAGADLGEQVTVTRTSESQLLVEALVDTDQRKAQLIQALESVRNNPAVRIKVSTIAEAVSRQSKSRATPESVIIERQDGSNRPLTADSDLHRYFSAKGLSSEQVDLEVRSLANRAVNESAQMMVHAWAIKRLGERFSVEQLHALTPEARAKWLAIVRAHAQSVRQETAGLRQELQPIFPSAASSTGEEQPEIGNDADLLRAIERLFEVCGSNDRMVGSAFAIKASGPSISDLQGPQFWRSLRRVEQLAGRIASSQ